MPSRRRSREHALQVLYLWDMQRIDIEQAIAQLYGSLAEELPGGRVEAPDVFMEELARGTVRRLEQIDELVRQHSQHWRLERMSVVDRNILRLGVYEMLHVGTPAPIVIDEAVELARRYSGEEAVRFVNGILDAIYKRMVAEATTSQSG